MSGSYNRVVATPPSLDTPADIERRQIEGWRCMSPADKLAMVTGLTETVHALALAGVRARHPAASPREQFLRLAILILGRRLASAAYPDAAAIDTIP